MDSELLGKQVSRNDIAVGTTGKYIQQTPVLSSINISEDSTKPLPLSSRFSGNISADELVVAVSVSLVPSIVPVPSYSSCSLYRGLNGV